jgi:hypothetical protein
MSARRLTPEQLTRNALHRRAIEAVNWGMPAVNTDLMYQAMAREVKGGWNQIVYWSRLLDWKNQTLTPNPDAIYLMPFLNTAQAAAGLRATLERAALNGALLTVVSRPRNVSSSSDISWARRDTKP